ncbi:hypothetical protein GE061_000297 [Apolygus lucorum]|uniref:Uncharacterized protein n=1 Tax=Apolygus lucorum TaxID=248454 RepID=A0A8S9Y3W0_APOLU|nr:hypothetical protein GE061_000297 [Apolygus lucorum]
MRGDIAYLSRNAGCEAFQRKSITSRFPIHFFGCMLTYQDDGGSGRELGTQELVLSEPGVLLRELRHLCITLPSDPEWRNDNYFRLVQLHRHISEETVLPSKYKHVPLSVDILPAAELCKVHHDGREDSIACSNSWTHADLILTSRLLSESEVSRVDAKFQGEDLEQTRRVLTLAFNILRFKPLLKEALDDNEFFQIYPKFQKCPWKVWLLLYDLYRRDFQQREKLEEEDQSNFDEDGLSEIDEVLWNNKVSLAATISRLRIKRIARTIEDLLPPHLQLPHHILNKTIIGGWVNTFKIKISSFETSFSRDVGFTKLDHPCEILPELSYAKDHVVPKYFHCHPKECGDILNSSLVNDKYYIIQDRSQCMGAITFLKVMEQLELCGSVAQTHIATPPSTAYLASMIAHNPNIDQLLIFSTGSKKSEYEEYFKDVGACNITIFSEHFSEITPENSVLQNIIAVMACPPSSNTAVSDPVNLAMARDGDISVLYALTEDYFNSQVDPMIIKSQRETLLKAMSMPQIQAIIYESHSRSAEENEKMVHSAVEEINQWAADKHWEETLQGQTSPTPNEFEEPEVASVESTVEEVVIQVPLCDLYEVSPIPDLCPKAANCVLLNREGVYLALLKRKEITRLDPKYMISMAEIRGLFGRQPDTTTLKAQKKKAIKTRSFSWKESSTPTKPLVELERLSAPTMASKRKDIRMSGELLECERFAVHIRNAFCDDGLLARLWWKTLLNYIQRNMHRKSKYPALRLRRPVNATNKDLFPTHYTSLDLDLLLMEQKHCAEADA